MQQRNFRLFDRTNLTKTLICPRQIGQTPLTNAIKHLELQKNMHKLKCVTRKNIQNMCVNLKEINVIYNKNLKSACFIKKNLENTTQKTTIFDIIPEQGT